MQNFLEDNSGLSKKFPIIKLRCYLLVEGTKALSPNYVSNVSPNAYASLIGVLYKLTMEDLLFEHMICLSRYYFGKL